MQEAFSVEPVGDASWEMGGALTKHMVSITMVVKEFVR